VAMIVAVVIVVVTVVVVVVRWSGITQVVTWTPPTAKDSADGGVTPVCDAVSGTAFTVPSQTVVTCTATDMAGNVKCVAKTVADGACTMMINGGVCACALGRVLWAVCLCLKRRKAHTRV
jgi:hypothetical protein